MNVLLIGSRALDRDGPGDAKLGFWSWKALSGAGYSTSVVILKPEPSLRKAGHTFRALLSGAPLQIGVTFSSDAYGRVVRTPAPPDLVVAVHARAAAHVPAELRRRGLALLIDSYGQSYGTYAGRLPKPLDLIYRFERRRMERYERKLVAEFARTAVVSERDRDFLRRAAAAPSSVISLSVPVDLEHFAQTRRRPVADRPVFAFVGRLNYLPNRDAVQWLARDIWPQLRARWPNARMRVVGARPDGALRSLLRHHGVELAADVADIRPYLEDVTALFVPMRMGGGMQTKILEAMAACVPVISTAFGGRGMTARAEEQMLLAETPDEYVRQASRLETPGFAASLAATAQAWVEAHHAPQVFERQLLEACRAIAG